LVTNLSEDILITNAIGTRTQTWYYPSPSDCLICHTPAANYVLGVKTRQLNGNFTYPSSGIIDNQLRALNRVGLFNPAFNETNIAGYSQLVPGTNTLAPLVDRARSYLDANCAQCHRPGGSGPTFDARWDTPLANQNIINTPVVKGDLGFDNARVVVPKDIWRSILYQRSISLDPAVKMPTLARNVVDANNMIVIADWINSLAGIPAVPPPGIVPAGGAFSGSVNVTLMPADPNSTLYYTLDGSLPTTSSSLYSGPFAVSNSLTVNANAFRSGYNNSVAAHAQFIIAPGVLFTSEGFNNQMFQVQVSGSAGKTYVLQASTNLVNWVSLSTNVPIATPFTMSDPGATNYPARFYRVLQQ
jgi:hypothetical protein